MPGKRSASWQLFAVVMGLKTMQSGKKRRKMAKTNPKEKPLNGKCNFLVAVVIEIFSLMIYDMIEPKNNNFYFEPVQHMKMFNT